MALVQNNRRVVSSLQAGNTCRLDQDRATPMALTANFYQVDALMDHRFGSWSIEVSQEWTLELLASTSGEMLIGMDGDTGVLHGVVHIVSGTGQILDDTQTLKDLDLAGTVITVVLRANGRYWKCRAA